MNPRGNSVAQWVKLSTSPVRTGLSSSFSISDPVSCKCAWKAMDAFLSSWIPATHVGDLDSGRPLASAWPTPSHWGHEPAHRSLSSPLPARTYQLMNLLQVQIQTFYLRHLQYVCITCQLLSLQHPPQFVLSFKILPVASQLLNSHCIKII